MVLFEPKDLKTLQGYKLFAVATIIVGLSCLIFSMLKFFALCQDKALSHENLLYIYAGITCGIVFPLAGVLVLSMFRVLKKYMK